MKFKVSPESAIRYVKLFVEPIVCWPPAPSATKKDLIIRDALLLMAAFFPVAVLGPLIVTISYDQDDVIKATKNLSILIAVSFTIFKMIMCRYHRAQFQIYFAELDEFMKTAGARERELLERYVDKCGPLYTFVGVAAVATYLSFVCGPLVLPQTLPADILLPFAFEDYPIRIALLYIMELLVGIQTVSAVIVDIQVALLLWFSAIRFELLAEDFMMAANLSEFNKCVEKHQKLLAFAEGVISTVRYIILAVTTVTTLGNLSTGYQLVHHQPLAVLAQFVFMLSVMSMEVLMYAWPADNLMNVSGNIVYAVYSSDWVGSSPAIIKNIQIVMLRAQKPVVISIGGILPALNLDFYGKYLTTSFSYFTTLKAVVG